MEQTKNHSTEINLSEVDWNKLTPEEYQKIHAELKTKQREAKKREHKTERASGEIAIQLYGNTYMIKQSVFLKLKTLKSEKAKQKLIENIITFSERIEEL